MTDVNDGSRSGARRHPIFKILRPHEWPDQAQGIDFTGSDVDVNDGYIHLSTAAQAPATAAKHFAGEANLRILAVDADSLGAALKWEPSRGGDLFPHLHGPLPAAAVLWTAPLPLGPDGRHVFPARFAEGRAP